MYILQAVNTGQISDGQARARDSVMGREIWVLSNCVTSFLFTLLGLHHRLAASQVTCAVKRAVYCVIPRLAILTDSG